MARAPSAIAPKVSSFNDTLLRTTIGETCGRETAILFGATEHHRDDRETLVTVKISISLTDEQHAFAQTLVETGRYASLSAVLKDGVDLLRQRTDAEALEIEALRELVSRRQKGEFVSPAEMDVRLERMFAHKRRGAVGRISEA